MENDTPTLEEMLAALAKAYGLMPKPLQYAFPFDKKWYLVGVVLFPPDNHTYRPVHLLEILLDPAGLRAAYGDYPSNTAHGFFSDGDFRIQKVIPQWTTNAHTILDAYLSSHEGNAEQAIRTAFQLLPKSHDA